MPFGLKNAPSVFQRFVNILFRDMIEANQIIIYMDDILIATPDVDSHWKILRQVLQVLTIRGLELNLKKCGVAQGEIDYLGYSVSAAGISPSQSHVKAINEYPLPTSVKEVRSCSFLILPSFYSVVC